MIAPDTVEAARVLAVREPSRRGQDWIAIEVGIAARTVNRILAGTRCLGWSTATR